MQTSGDSSVWRSLAVAFGDGLAFGVGVKLSHTAAAMQAGKRNERPPAAPAAAPTAATLAAPLAVTPGSMDQKVLEAITNALDARFKEHAGQVGRQLADLEAKVAIEAKSLDEQDRLVAAKVTADLNALEGQIIKLHREFGEAVARIVAEQVSLQVEARAAALENTLETRIGAAVKAGIETAVSQRLTTVERQLREEIGAKDREIGELRQRLADSDDNLLEIVSGIGQICRQAAERMGRPVAEKQVPLETSEPEEAPALDSAAEVALPAFTQPPQPSRLWRVPLVSSLVVLASGGAFLAHYWAHYL